MCVWRQYYNLVLFVQHRIEYISSIHILLYILDTLYYLVENLIRKNG